MDLKILGSSSAGNCYVFDNGIEALVVECGIKFSDVEKALDFDITRLKGAVVSHEHGDHAKYVSKFLDARVPVYMSAGTMHKVIKGDYDGFMPFMVENGCMFNVGGFRVLPFNVQHDAAEPMGFLIYHPETGTTLFATDTYYLQYKFADLNNILLECNYSLEILDANIKAGKLNQKLRNRTIKSHCSFDTCRETLLVNDLTQVNNIVLIHLSDGNSNASEFQQGIAEATGKTVHIAQAGMTLKFNKTPF